MPSNPNPNTDPFYVGPLWGPTDTIYQPSTFKGIFGDVEADPTQSFEITSSEPLLTTVQEGSYYLIRAADADVTLTEELDGNFEPLSENGTLVAGASSVFTFNSNIIRISTATAARIWITQSKVSTE